MKNALISVGVSVLVVVLGFFALNKPVVVEKTFGVAAGPDITERQYFMDGAVIGGTNFATSSVGAATYTAAQIFNNSIITHTAASALTATLPASSTIPFIRRPGDTKTVYIFPVTTGITLAAGTGTDLNTASSTKFCVVNQMCRLDFVRKANTDIEVLLTSSTGL